jgi:methionyl-tRNA formyltransferase
MNSGKIVAIVGKDSGRALVKKFWEMGANLTDVFVKDEKYRINGSGFKTFDDLFYKKTKTRLHKIQYLKDKVQLLKDISPELIVMNFSEIIKEEILNIPKKGIVGFHYAELPDRRGCNPDMWAIIHGLTKSVVTLHYYDKRIDAGDIIDTEPFLINFEEDSQDVLNKINKGVVELMGRNLEKILNETAPRIKQEGKGIYTPRRTFEDGEINWARMKAIDIYNLIRALRPPYGGAYSLCGKKEAKQKLYLLRGNLVNEKEIKNNKIIDWREKREIIHEKVKYFGEMYSLTGHGIIKITETRIGEIQE